MIADFKISKSGTNGILVEGIDATYTAEDGIRSSLRQYTYSDTITLNALISLSAQATETYISSTINVHNIVPIDASTFSLTKDGLYLIKHLIIPTKTWFDYIVAEDQGGFDDYDEVYYYNVTDGFFYKYSNGVSIKVTVENVIVANHDDTTLSTNLVRADKNTFIMYKLNDCFNTICKNILINLPIICNNSVASQTQIRDRDVL